MQKKYRKIGEIAKELDINASAIRHWEKEIPQLKPKKNRSGHRVYTAKDFEIIKIVSHCKSKGYTLKGIIKKLEEKMPINTPENFYDEMKVHIANLRSLAEDL